MKMKLSSTILSLAALTAFASTQSTPTISGDYLEVRSCDVYTGPCFANAEMNLCGNEETYYPPLTCVEHAMPAFTERASFKGRGLNLTWEATGQRSAFVASFSR